MGFGPHQAFGAQGQVPSVPVGLTRPCPGTQDIVSQLQTSTTLPRYTSPSFHSTLPQPGHLWTYQTIQDNESAADHSRNQNKSSARGPPTDYCSAPEGQRPLELRTQNWTHQEFTQSAYTHKRHMQHKENIGISVLLRRHLVWF